MATLTPKLITDRCILRELEVTDVQGMFDLDSDAEVMKYLGGKTISSPEESLKTIDFVRQQYNEFGIGRWAVCEKITGEFLGWCGLKWIHEPLNNHSHFYDLGYRFRRQVWGKGIASECAVACRDYAFTEMNIPVLYAAAHVENAASNRILVKLGFQLMETCLLWDHPHYWYKMKNPV